ncbi:MAG TPA: DUF4381 domain-containing protein [Gammaproteobacteria bacterium]|nr:DUF4381 domain-containing protein [Gammaproteobacteria bacterium]
MNQTPDYSQLPLRDIHLPGAIGWWPPAFGWWLVAALVLAGFAAYAVYYYRGRHKRAALRALTRVRAALEQGAEPVACLQYVSTILRRFAMTSVGAAPVTDAAVDVPGLIGERWLHYLDGRWERTEFSAGLGRQLLVAPYARPNSIERAAAIELTGLCSAWLTAQRATGTSTKRARAA